MSTILVQSPSSAQLRALQCVDILFDILDRLAPYGQCTSLEERRSVLAFAGTSKLFYALAFKVLWARLPCLLPLLFLLPEVDRLYHAGRARKGDFDTSIQITVSEAPGGEVLSQIRSRAACLQVLGEDISGAAHKCWKEPIINDAGWSYLLRLFGDEPGLFPSLERLAWHPTPSCDDLRLLSAPSLLQVELRDHRYAHGSQFHEGDMQPEWQQPLASALRQMLMRAPSLSSLTLNVATNNNVLAMTPRDRLVQLRDLALIEEELRNCATFRDDYPTAACLRLISTLPLLKLTLDFNMQLSSLLRLDLPNGFHTLEDLCIFDYNTCAAPFLQLHCSAPALQTLSVIFAWDMPRGHAIVLTTTIAQRFPALTALCLMLPAAWEPFETMFAPLLTLPRLSQVTLHLEQCSGEHSLSDAYLMQCAEAWSDLRYLEIYYDLYSENQVPATVTLDALISLATQCLKLQTLLLPHLYVEDYTASNNIVLPRIGHRLRVLAITVVDIADEARDMICAITIARLFPNVDIAMSLKKDAEVARCCSLYRIFSGPRASTAIKWKDMLARMEKCR
ncbi:hypothetical protein OH77DRAFT_1032342 [Trametes cingulata]|nr:hypothetical protein OH77DRAFT_1032342 [Trametes cingulata]